MNSEENRTVTSDPPCEALTRTGDRRTESALRIVKGNKRWQLVALAASTVVLAACGTTGNTPSGGGAQGTGEYTPPPGVKTLKELYAGTYAQPPTTSPPGAKGKSVWFVAAGMSTEGSRLPAAAAEEAAKHLGLNFHIADGRFNEGGGYTQAVRTALAANADAIMMYGVPCELTQGALQDAKNQGVPVLGVETPDCSAGGGPDLFTVEEKYSDTYKDAVELWKGYGAMQADYAINKTRGKAKVILSEGVQPEPLLKSISDGFQEQIRKCADCEIVARLRLDSASFLPNSHWIQGLRAEIAKHPEANVAHMPFEDLMDALGGAQAVKEAGRNDMLIVGGQGRSDGMQMVKDGRIPAITTARDMEWSGYAAIDTINRALQGQETVPEGLGFQLVDRENNLPKNNNDYVPPIDFKAAYLKAWGVQ